MVIGAVPGRSGRAAKVGLADLAELVEPIGPAEPVASKRPRPMRRHGWAAATQDRFMDAVVLLSVLLFLALAVGVGTLVLQATWPS